MGPSAAFYTAGGGPSTPLGVAMMHWDAVSSGPGQRAEKRPSLFVVDLSTGEVRHFSGMWRGGSNGDDGGDGRSSCDNLLSEVDTLELLAAARNCEAFETSGAGSRAAARGAARPSPAAAAALAAAAAAAAGLPPVVPMAGPAAPSSYYEAGSPAWVVSEFQAAVTSIRRRSEENKEIRPQQQERGQRGRQKQPGADTAASSSTASTADSPISELAWAAREASVQRILHFAAEGVVVAKAGHADPAASKLPPPSAGKAASAATGAAPNCDADELRRRHQRRRRAKCTAFVLLLPTEAK